MYTQFNLSKCTCAPGARNHSSGLAHQLFRCILLVSVTLTSSAALAEKCLYVSSYHKGYAWSDGVEKGVQSVLQDRCEIKQFDMDTKRNKSTQYKKQAALKAKSLIEKWQPDIVITADDNAAKYLIKQYYKDSEIPFVFCGVNWTAEEYGFPYSNVTGIIEVAPIRPLFDQVKALLKSAKNALYIGATTTTEQKNYKRFAKVAARESIDIESIMAATTEDWLAAYRRGQDYDFLIIGSKAGITDWNKQTVIDRIKSMTKKLSVTNHGWMMPYTMLGFTKIPEEQGELAAQAALSILDGVDISRIAIVPNRKWDVWTNTGLLDVANIKLPQLLMRKSKQLH